MKSLHHPVQDIRLGSSILVDLVVKIKILNDLPRTRRKAIHISPQINGNVVGIRYQSLKIKLASVVKIVPLPPCSKPGPWPFLHILHLRQNASTFCLVAPAHNPAS